VLLVVLPTTASTCLSGTKLVGFNVSVTFWGLLILSKLSFMTDNVAFAMFYIALAIVTMVFEVFCFTLK
jgi:hypothetical protein